MSFRKLRRLWAAMLAIAAVVSGCGDDERMMGAKMLEYSQVPGHELPASLADWEDFEPAPPTILASEHGDHMYLLISMGDCSPADSEVYVHTVARNGPNPLLIMVKFRESGSRADQDSPPPTTIIRIKLQDLHRASRDTFFLHEHGYYGWALTTESDPGADTRVYTPEDDYQCRVPVPSPTSGN